MRGYLAKVSFVLVPAIMENSNLFKQQQVSDIMRQMRTQAQTAGQYFTNDQIKEMIRKVSAEVNLLNRKPRISRFGSFIIVLLQKIIFNFLFIFVFWWFIIFMVFIKLLPIT